MAGLVVEIHRNESADTLPEGTVWRFAEGCTCTPETKEMEKRKCMMRLHKPEGGVRRFRAPGRTNG